MSAISMCVYVHKDLALQSLVSTSSYQVIQIVCGTRVFLALQLLALASCWSKAEDEY